MQYVEFTEANDPLSPINYWYITSGDYTQLFEPSIENINFSVDQNYPNPARGTTEILVKTKSNLPVELSMSNILGQIVYQDKVSGLSHSPSFKINTSGFDPGIYLYTISVGAQSLTKKMLVE